MHCASSKGHLTTAEALIATAFVIAISRVVWLGFEINEDRESLCGCDLFSAIAYAYTTWSKMSQHDEDVGMQKIW